MVDEIAIVWMSAGNSYFNEQNIEKILRFADESYKKILILSPDIPAEHTLRALGYPENKTKRKAKLNANLLKNRAARILLKLKAGKKFHFVNWIIEIVNNPEYQERYKEIMNLYENNPIFKRDARLTTRNVLRDNINKSINIEKAIDEAVFYLIEELSFIFSCPSIYNAKKVIYLYHRKWDIYENIIRGSYDGIKRDNFSFGLMGKLDNGS